MRDSASLDAIFKPKSVAVIGASTAAGKLGHDILANLRNGGFPGDLYPINTKADEILGLKVYQAIAEVPKPPELAVVVIPARLVAARFGYRGKRPVRHIDIMPRLTTEIVIGSLLTGNFLGTISPPS